MFQREKTYRSVILETVMVGVILHALILMGCGGPPSHDKLMKIAGYGQQVSAQLEANWSLPESLFEQHVIDEKTHTLLRSIFSEARKNIDDFNDGMKTVLAQANPNPAVLVPVASRLIENVRALEGFKNPSFDKALAVIEISLRAIAAYFASKASELRQYLDSPSRQPALERHMLAHYGIAPERVQRARSLMHEQRTDAKNRAVAEVFALGDDGARQVALIESFATQGS